MYKPRRITPLEAVRQLRIAQPALANETLGYAGRLDPLAEGLLLLLVGDENQRVMEYRSLSKVYEIDVLFGLRTDSYDLAGYVSDSIFDTSTFEQDKSTLFAEALRGQVGTMEQTFPPFSSVKVDGHPAFYWARRGEVPKSGWPKRVRTIHEIEHIRSTLVEGRTVATNAMEDIESLQGEFRQTELIARWRQLEERLQSMRFFQCTLRVSCSSGTFMRAIAHSLGTELGVGALATRILRVKCGEFSIEGRFGDPVTTAL